MAYQPSIPQPNDRLRTSQGDLLGNFQASAGGLGTMLNPNLGVIYFPQQGATPTIPATLVGLYSSNYAITGRNELYAHVNAGTSVPAQEIPITARGTFWTMLASGLIIKWGTDGPAAAGATTVVNVPNGNNVTGPVMTSIITVQITPLQGGAPTNSGVGFRTITGPNAFSYSNPAASAGINFWLIGTI